MPELAESVTGAVAQFLAHHLDELAAACAQGYAEARAPATGERQRRRHQLLGVILSDPPPRADLVAGLARAAGWALPAQVAMAALGERRPPDAPALPPDVLADWARPDPHLLLPDPDGPGRAAVIDRALRGWLAAIGPAVPLARAAMSLRWARHGLALARAGVIADGGGPVRCDQHLSTLLILADEDLAGALRASRLAPLARLRPAQRERIAETLLAWLQLGENAAEVAHRLHVHPQTVRYRLRQIHELFGAQLRDPDRRFELQLALRVRQLTGRLKLPETPPVNPPPILPVLGGRPSRYRCVAALARVIQGTARRNMSNKKAGIRLALLSALGALVLGGSLLQGPRQPNRGATMV